MLKELNCDNIFYSVIGNHAGETPYQIIRRKQQEINKCGYSLWSAKIDKKSVEQVWNLNQEDEVVVLCKINDRARDPVVFDNSVYYAKTMTGPNGLWPIPDGVKTSFTKGKDYQAYVVSKYIMLDESEMFEFANFNATSADGIKKSFTERFKCSQFQNVYGRRSPNNIISSCKKPIGAIMVLRYPFVVNLK